MHCRTDTIIDLYLRGYANCVTLATFIRACSMPPSSQATTWKPRLGFPPLDLMPSTGQIAEIASPSCIFWYAGFCQLLQEFGFEIAGHTRDSLHILPKRSE